jgi:cGMP-dependent protein kinase
MRKQLKVRSLVNYSSKNITENIKMVSIEEQLNNTLRKRRQCYAYSVTSSASVNKLIHLNNNIKPEEKGTKISSFLDKKDYSINNKITEENENEELDNLPQHDNINTFQKDTKYDQKYDGSSQKFFNHEKDDRDVCYEEFDKSGDLEKTFQFLDKPITPDEEEKLKEALKKHFLFKELNDDIMRIIIEDLIEFQLAKDTVLFEENEEGNYFYIVKKGQFQLYIKNEPKKVFNTWDCFGELSLLHKSKRTGTVRSLTDAEVYVLDGESFRELISSITNKRLKNILFFLDMVPMFRSLDNIQKSNIASMVQEIEFESQEKIISEGELGNKIYIIKDGVVSCRIRSKEIRKLYSRDCFGQNSLLIDNRRSLDVYSQGKTVLYELSKSALEEALGVNYKDVILHSIFQDCIRKNPYFSDLFMESQLEKFFKIFNFKIYKNNDVVYLKEQKLNKKVIIIIEGNLVNVY